MATDAQTTLTPPSESSSTTEGDKSEEMDVKEPKREESFRRRFNPAIQRTSRLRSSLIFSSQLEQHISQEQKCNSGQHCEETANEEDDQSRLSLTAQVLGKRRSITREPFEWRLKSATVDNSTIESLKSEDINTDSGDKELTKYLPVSTDKVSSMEQPNPAHEEQTKTVQSAHPAKPAQVEQPKTIQSAHQASSLSNKSYIDMNDPDSRLFFFKELAAKRKAAKAAESESSAEKAPVKPVTPFDLKIKNPVTRIEPSLPIAALNPADTSTNKPAPADTSTNKPAPSTEAVPNPSDTSTKKPTTSIEAPLNPADTSIKKTATSTEASSETLKTSPVLQENKTSMAKWSSLLDVREHTSKNNEQQDYQLPKSDSKTFFRDKLSCVDGLLRVSTDTEKIELKNSQNQSVSKVNPRDTSTFLKSTSKECTFNIAPKDFSLYKSPKKPKSFNPVSNELNPSLPLTLTEASSSSYPTPKSLSSTSLTSSKNAAKESSSALTPTLKEDSSSIPTSKQPLPSSKPITVESNIPLSPTQSEPGVSHKQDKTDSKESLSPTPMQSCSSSIPATEFSPPPNPTQAESSFLPKSTLVGSTSSTPMESNTSPKPSTKESLSTIATTDLRSSSPKTNPIKSYSSPCPGQHESVLSPKRSKTACNSSPKPSTASNVSSNSSPPSSKHVMEETNKSLILTPTKSSSPPEPTPTESSASTNPTPRELNPLPSTTPTEPSASTGPTLTESRASSNPSPTKSLSSLTCGSGGSVVCPKPGQTKSRTSPNLTPKESCSSPNHTLTEPTSPFNPVLVESVPSSNSNPTESTASHDTVPAPPVVVDNSKEGKPSNLNKEQKAGNSAAYKGEKIAGDPETKSKTAPGESPSHGPQSPDETKENNSNMKPESTIDQSNPISPPVKLPKVSQSHYHSSTASVLSSSNLIDDTKLLLEQISANSQSRTELTKESAVTDDAKQDEADRGVSGKEEASARRQIGGLARTSQEREKLLQRIESMRKGRKVYSRFEMAP